MDDDYSSSTKYSPYDQKAFLQIRLHDSISFINKISISPLYYDQDFESYNYEMIFNTLNAIFLTIISKLDPEEEEEIIVIKNKLQQGIDEGVFIQTNSEVRGKGIKFVKDNWDKIRENLFQYRKFIEVAMEKHKFNPSSDSLDYENE